MKNNNIKIDQETLASILEQHQLWIKSGGKNGKRADLYGKDLIGIKLGRANLRRAKLYGADLYEADLDEANLCRASLIGANLIGASLIETKLDGADLCGANLRGAMIEGTSFDEANLDEANLDGTGLETVNLDLYDQTPFETSSLLVDSLQRNLQSSEKFIQDLQIKLKQAQSDTVRNDEEITKLLTQLEREKIEKEKIKEKLNSKIKELTEGLSNRIKEAQKSLSGALKNTDSQIQNNENTACWFKRLGIILFTLAIILLLVFSGFVLCYPKFFAEKNLNILFYTFPIITLMMIGTTCLRHQKNLLGEIRHFSNMKHQIELYSGLLEASQHAAVSFNNPEKANEYVQETFTQIRNRLLNSQYLPDNSSADKQSDNDFGSDKVLDLLNKIADLSGKKSMGS
ncbi:pentapeptide repeat-containing protein [Neisseria sp. HMSC70E02]|jgi:hypothetical protein|uniref:pentapeptide repeat-containing protein n=1 Tax=Neisseria sp. HMSC70E02 TaxID=1608896 RepID=UPI0008A9D3D5|nr:pentapeptide repeat-containing protein [Neisseria sp. HMSC70E02]OHR75316.1 hypothetical protein HMPREF3277_07105 [Neisseria sp. HMSC70E02]